MAEKGVGDSIMEKGMPRDWGGGEGGGCQMGEGGGKGVSDAAGL